LKFVEDVKGVASGYLPVSSTGQASQVRDKLLNGLKEELFYGEVLGSIRRFKRHARSR
jgi:hypothetical protein